jgi:putative DNA primase/helicase
VRAGQEVRVVDVPADTGVHGLFEDLHGFPNAGAFAQHLVDASSRFYGTAARAFIEKIASDRDCLREAVDDAIRAFASANCPNGSDGQVERVAARFGLIAAAGESAAGLGIVPWQSGDARSAAETCFAAWLSNRGGIEAAEIREGIRALRDFISRNGTSRFQAAWDDDKKDERVINLAGFRRRMADGDWEYFLTADGWKEATTGFDARSLAATLKERGLLLASRAQTMRIPGVGMRRVYQIAPMLMEGE